MYKLVLRCPALNERRFWYVSGRTEAKRIIRRHMHTMKGPKLPQYRGMTRGVDYFIELTPAFKDYDGSAPETFKF